ncbi:MAG TPA: hypothetical protein VGA50_04120 [Kiloniellales bacterium]
MSANYEQDLSVASVVRDLDAVRMRLDHASAWIRNGETTVSAAALAEQVRLLCQQASSLSDPRAALRLLPTIMKSLQDLEALLGLH